MSLQDHRFATNLKALSHTVQEIGSPGRQNPAPAGVPGIRVEAFYWPGGPGKEFDMSLRKISVSGRTSILALSALAVLVLAGGLIVAGKAHAQGNPGRGAPSFAPVLCDGSDHILVGLQLPAARREFIWFRVEATMGDGSVLVLSAPPEPIRKSSFFDVFFTVDAVNGGYVLHMAPHGSRDGEVTAPAPDTSVALRILPAVQRNGDLVQPLSAGLTVSGQRNAVLGDGSVVPIPFTYGLEGPEERQG